MARRAGRTALLFAAAMTASGCWFHVEEVCPDCAIVDHAHTAIPPTAPFTHTEVVLVHGSLGFGDEWRPVIEAVRESPGFDLVAWTWPGPFRNPPRDALALRAEIQALLDGLPSSVEEIIVLAHSAGGLLTNLAIRQLNVPAGRHVTVAFLDATFWPRLEKREKYGPLPPGVTATVFFAKDPPGHVAPKGTPNGAEGTDMPWEYVGAVGHDPMVAKASLPILNARRDAKRAEVRSGGDSPRD
jgi:pimeloyl-ACP methyl ester carboxylesterase